MLMLHLNLNDKKKAVSHTVTNPVGCKGEKNPFSSDTHINVTHTQLFLRFHISGFAFIMKCLGKYMKINGHSLGTATSVQNLCIKTILLQDMCTCLSSVKINPILFTSSYVWIYDKQTCFD